MSHRAAAESCAPANRPGAALRLVAEVVAWIAVPWALWKVSEEWALAAVVLLISLPIVFTTPGDRGNQMVPVPGGFTIAIDALVFLAAVVAAWVAWPAVAAFAVSVLVVAAIAAQWRRWRWLTTAET